MHLKLSTDSFYSFHLHLWLIQEAQLLQIDRAMRRVIEYFASHSRPFKVTGNGTIR